MSNKRLKYLLLALKAMGEMKKYDEIPYDRTEYDLVLNIWMDDTWTTR